MNAECCEKIRDFLVPVYNLVLYLNDTAIDEIDIHTVKRLSIISDESINMMLDLMKKKEEEVKYGRKNI